MADDLWQDVGVAGVTELSLLGELPDLHQAQEISLQLIHLVGYVSVQRENLSRDFYIHTRVKKKVNKLYRLINKQKQAMELPRELTEEVQLHCFNQWK